MNPKFGVLIVLAVIVLLLSSSCRAQAPAVIPVTGGMDDTTAIAAESVRMTIVDHVIADHIADLPTTGWQLDPGTYRKGEYHLHTGDWHMIMWQSQMDGNWHIIVRNRVGNPCWWGYIDPDGKVVDTDHMAL